MKPMKPLIAMLAGLSLTVMACDADYSVVSDQPAPINTSFDDQPQPVASAPSERPQPQQDYDNGPTEISGRIVSLRNVEVDSSNVDHLLADVKTADTGHTFMVDLGPTETLKRQSMNPLTGDAITVSGELGMFNGSSMLIADRLNNKSLAFDAPADSEANAQASTEKQEHLGIRQRLVAGKVIDVKEADINGQNHLLAKVETFGGHVAVIDLGMKEQMPKLSIENGQQIVAFGTVGRLNKLPLVVAEKVGQIMEVPGREIKQPGQAATFQQPVDQPALNTSAPAPENPQPVDAQPAR